MAIVKIKVQPGSGRNEITGRWLDMVKVKVTAAPEGGRANKACIELVARELGVPKNKIKIIKGLKSCQKQLQIDGLTDPDLERKLNHLALGIPRRNSKY